MTMPTCQSQRKTGIRARMIGLGLLAGLSGIVASTQYAAAEDVTLQLGWLPQGQASALFYGVGQKCFTDKNISLTIKRGYGAADTITKIVTGAAQFGQADLGAIITQTAKNDVPIKAVMPLFSDSALTIGVRGDSEIQSLKDLEGRSLAAGPGEGGLLLLPIAMKKAGGDAAKVEYKTMEPAALAGSLLQGQVDSIMSYVTTVAGINEAAQKAGRSVRGIHFGKSLEIYGDVFFAANETVEKNPDLVNRFREAVRCSYNGAKDNPEAAVRAMVETAPEMDADRELRLAKIGWGLVFDSASPALTWDEKRIEQTARFTAESQGLPSVPASASFVFN